MNTLPPLPLIEGALFISGTFLEMTCPRMQEFYKIHQRVAAHKSGGLDFGSKLHSALELHARMQEWTKDPKEVGSAVVALLSYLYTIEPSEEGDWRNLNWAVEVYSRYAEKFSFDPWEVMRYEQSQPCSYCNNSTQLAASPCPYCVGHGVSSLMVEVPFTFHLFDTPSFPVYYHGFIDMLCRRNGLLYVRDYKTTSMLGTAFFDGLRMSATQKGYAYAVQELIKEKVNGHVVTTLRTKEPPIWLKEGEQPKKGPPKKASDWWDESFQEEIYYLGDGELEEWKLNTIALVQEFLWHYENGYFPKKTSRCAAPFKCSYYDTCSTFPAKDRMIMLNSDMYKPHTPKLKKEITV